MLLTFLVLLIAGAAVPVVLFSSVEVAGLTGLTPFRLHTGPSHVRRAASGAWTVTQAYVWLGWAAYCSSLGLRYAIDPVTGNPWIYVILSIVATGLPIAYLRVKDRLTSGPDDEQRVMLQGSNFWRVFVLSGCVCFWIAPHLMLTPYGWLLQLSPRADIASTVEIGTTGSAGAQSLHVGTSPPSPNEWRASFAGSAGDPQVEPAERGEPEGPATCAELSDEQKADQDAVDGPCKKGSAELTSQPTN